MDWIDYITLLLRCICNSVQPSIEIEAVHKLGMSSETVAIPPAILLEPELYTQRWNCMPNY